MRTSAFSLPTGKAHGSGFTLIEVLVVLVIVGLLAGVALPRFFQISQRYSIASERDNLLTAIGNLGYSAYSSGKLIELGPMNPETKAYAVFLPPGWRIEMPQIIRYGFNGTCSGGSIVLQSPDGLREKYELKAPACKPVLAP